MGRSLARIIAPKSNIPGLSARDAAAALPQNCLTTGPMIWPDDHAVNVTQVIWLSAGRASDSAYLRCGAGYPLTPCRPSAQPPQRTEYIGVTRLKEKLRDLSCFRPGTMDRGPCPLVTAPNNWCRETSEPPPI